MTPNAQKPEPFDSESGASLDVHSIFPTIQGEGPFTGHPAIFIRLAGCNLQCPWCDTEYTAGRTSYTMARMVSTLSSIFNEYKRIKLIVITGGEPLRQDLGPLIGNIALTFPFAKVQIETNGVLGLSDTLIGHTVSRRLFVVCSPKTSHVHETIHRWACAFKYVLEHSSVSIEDGLPLRALGHKAKPYIARPHRLFAGDIYVNPMDSKDVNENNRNTQAAVEVCRKYGYIFGLQVHKFIDVP